MKHNVHFAGNLFRQLPTCDRFEMDPCEIHRLSVAMQGHIGCEEFHATTESTKASAAETRDAAPGVIQPRGGRAFHILNPTRRNRAQAGFRTRR